MEEPTGLERRVNEVVSVPLGAGRSGFTVLAPDSRELPWQVAGGELLFPVSLMPGELPVYRIACCSAPQAAFANEMILRRIGLARVEFGNARFRAIVDLKAGAIVEAYTLSAGPQRALNLVDDAGWTGATGAGEIKRVELVETGPLRGVLRLDDWEIVWTTGSQWFRWRARGGFRFSSVSAAPFLPFDRCVDLSEYRWPDGGVQEEPPDHDVSARPWDKLPGGGMVYYQHAENYGALGIVALDAALRWKGACSQSFEGARQDGAVSEIAVTLPEWKGIETLLDARRVARMLRQPVLTFVSGPEVGAAPVISASALREPVYKVEMVAQAPAPFHADSLDLNGEWELAHCALGSRPSGGWRTVAVPGSVHTQWLKAPEYYTREAEWINREEWWYRKRFVVPATWTGKRLRLQFGATDYYADAYLNGT